MADQDSEHPAVPAKPEPAIPATVRAEARSLTTLAILAVPTPSLQPIGTAMGR